MVDPAYADVELLLTVWLADILDIRCVTDLPAALGEAVPLLQVVRVGGADRQITLDEADVDIDAYVGPDDAGNPDRAGARELAEQARQAVRYQLPGVVFTDAVVARTQTIVAPAWRPYDNTALRRFGGSYRLTLHSRL